MRSIRVLTIFVILAAFVFPAAAQENTFPVLPSLPQSKAVSAALDRETDPERKKELAAVIDSIDRIYSFYPRSVLLDDPQSVASARYWAMARADSFRAAIEGTPGER